MIEPITLAAAITLLVKSAPIWLPPIRDAFVNKGAEKGAELAIDKGLKLGRSLLRLDEREQLHHLELTLKNAAERGLAKFHITEERDQYRSILIILSEPGSNSEELRREALRFFMLSDSPDLAKLSELYNHSLRFHTLTQPEAPKEVDAVPYLSSFFEALLAELYIDPLFHDQISDVIKVRADIAMQRSLTEILTTLHQIGGVIAQEYTTEQFERDVEDYITHMERNLRYLKLVGVVPKDRGNENTDPELDSIFVPLRAALQDQAKVEDQVHDSIVALLDYCPCLVLLGGPGSGKSTAVRHLAWSHALANLPSPSVSAKSFPLLSGKPVPLRIEVRRFIEDRRQRPDYNFLSYASEVLLGRAGLHITPIMFELLLERRAMLLLFDGLDEIATFDERRRLIEEIEEFAQRYPGNRILVTSRPIGYRLARFSNQWFFLATVQQFDDQQIYKFLERWYIHVLRLSPLPPNDQQELENLYAALNENSGLHILAENPLLLTVITALHRYERLPDKRVLVYDRCANLLLDTWAKLRGTDARWKDMMLRKEDQYACIAHLGFALHNRAQKKEEDSTDTEETQSRENLDSDVSAKFILREIERFFEIQRLFPSVAQQRIEAEHFLTLIQEEAGLIVERGNDDSGEAIYGFVHRTFQEYFAAADIYERYLQEENTRAAGRKVEPSISSFLTGMVALLEPEGDSRNG